MTLGEEVGHDWVALGRILGDELGEELGSTLGEPLGSPLGPSLVRAGNSMV
jgi:hypothetical protein